ncbi:hypothetical protein [Burkholderia ubonensis]|nr:hypothetical protein [Burkholderia ubonensis]
MQDDFGNEIQIDVVAPQTEAFVRFTLSDDAIACRVVDSDLRTWGVIA